jgi:hypothetical protein
MFFLVGPTQPAISFKSFRGGAVLSKKNKKMQTNAIVLYGDPTPSDFNFMIENSFSFSSLSSTSSTMSDAQSAPENLSATICQVFSRMLNEVGADLPSNWSPE